LSELVPRKSRKKAKPEKKPVGRPPVEIDIEQLKRLAQIGCTIEEAAVVLGCGRRTLFDRMKAEPELKEVWDDGQLLGKVSLRRLQWRHANGSGSSAVNMTIHLSKHRLGEVETHKHQGAVGVYDLSKLDDKKLAMLESILSGAATTPEV
jgi:hypothetical protein